ncbi:MAG: CHAT domain-containing protein [Thermoanaerobaculia bacterium]|nr:CHAT domain-containing protein [Thermoanaerobaculia bacterium]
MGSPTRPAPWGEIVIRVRGSSNGVFPVELLASGGQDFPAGALDAAALLPWVPGLDPRADGERLFQALFAHPALAAAWAELAGENPRRRLKLWLDPEAAALHPLPWELLSEPWEDGPPRPLAALADTPFSRYLPSREAPSPPVLERPFRLLVAIASPEGLPSWLAPLDVAAERAALEAVWAEVPRGEVVATFLAPPISLERLEAELRAGYHGLHLVAHGEFDEHHPEGPEAGSVVHLADETGRAQRVTAGAFAALLLRLPERPRLVFLASCATAQRSSDNAWLGFAPPLVAAGTGAVVAMQAPVLVATARAFATTFYGRLLAHGEVDRAANEARSSLLSGDRPGAEVPVLFQRLRSGRLLGQRGEIQGKPPEIFWFPLLESAAQGQLLAVLGPGVHQGLLPMPRQLARALAADPRFDYPDPDEESLPRVTQYLTAYRVHAQDVLRREMAEALERSLPAGIRARGDSVSEVASRAGWGAVTLADEADVHQQLASLGLPIYLTTNFDNLLTLALEAQGRTVHRLALPWKAVFRGEPRPRLPKRLAPGESLVLHLFGMDDDPDGMVVTEDDYLDYLTVISRDERHLLPELVYKALGSASVLLLGYRLHDLDLRVLLRGFRMYLDARKLGRSKIAVQFDPTASAEPGGERARAFLEKYFGQSDIEVYWGSAPQFVADLVSRSLATPARQDRDDA